jgi:hypothetical protein
VTSSGAEALTALPTDLSGIENGGRGKDHCTKTNKGVPQGLFIMCRSCILVEAFMSTVGICMKTFSMETVLAACCKLTSIAMKATVIQGVSQLPGGAQFYHNHSESPSGSEIRLNIIQPFPFFTGSSLDEIDLLWSSILILRFLLDESAIESSTLELHEFLSPIELLVCTIISGLLPRRESRMIGTTFLTSILCCLAKWIRF